jgi:hypothetical protein
MTRHDGDPDDDLVGSLLRRSDGPVVIRPLRAPAARGRRPYASILAATLVVVVVAGVAGVALNARRRDVAALPSPSSIATQASPSGANLAPQAGRGFVVNLGGHGIGIRTEADAAPYFQVTSRTLLSYAVSPDGKLAYWQTGPDDALPHALHVYDPATRTDRTVLTLTDERGGSSGFMVWSTDGGGLAIGTSDVGSAFEGQRAPSRPTVATWSLLDLSSGARRKISTISGAWVMPVSWDRQTDIATATEYGRDGPSTPTRLFYVWNPQRAIGKATQFVLPAAIEPFTARADSEAKYVAATESLQCAPSLCQSVWIWSVTDPATASVRRVAGHTLAAPAFRPGTSDLFAAMAPLCCTTPPPTERPTIVELGPPGSSTPRTVYPYSPGDANFFFRSDGGAIVVNNGDLNNRKGITVVDPTTGTTILLPVDRDGVQDVIGSIGPGPVRSTPSPAPSSPTNSVGCGSAPSSPAMRVCPSSGPVGSTVTLEGWGCAPPNSAADFVFVSDGPPYTGAFGGFAPYAPASDGDGHFVARFRIPSLIGDLHGQGGGLTTLGTYRLLTKPPACSVDFTVTASPAQAPVTGTGQWIARTAADVARNAPADPFIADLLRGGRILSTPVFVSALVPGSYDEWLLTTIDPSTHQLVSALALPIYPGGTTRGQANAVTGPPYVLTSPADAAERASMSTDPVIGLELVWAAFGPGQGGPGASEVQPFYVATRRSGAELYVIGNSYPVPADVIHPTR